jgi:hypothetical protein
LKKCLDYKAKGLVVIDLPHHHFFIPDTLRRVGRMARSLPASSYLKMT